MLKLTPLLSVTLLACGLFSAATLRAEDAPAPMVLNKADAAIKVDGLLDEPAWKTAQPIRVDYINSKQGVLSDEPRMTAWYTWDEHYLYLAYETFDRNLVAVADGQVQGPADNRRPGCEIFKDGIKVDVAEFFISFGDSQFFWEIHHNAANQFNDVWCIVADPKSKLSASSMTLFGLMFCHQMVMQDDGPYKLASAVRLKAKADGKPSTIDDGTPATMNKGSDNNESDKDTGYTAEIRLPWLAIGAPAEARTWIETPAAAGKPASRVPGPWKMAGRTLEVLAVLQDGDLPERYHHSSPLRSGDWFHKTHALWPAYQLGK